MAEKLELIGSRRGLAMATTEVEREEQAAEVLARFPRPNRTGGADEQIRVTVGPYRGKLVTSLRTWFSARRPTRDHDGYLPSRNGHAIREHELDPLIDALTKIRDRVEAEGRPTSPQPLPPRGSASSPDRGEWRSDAGLPRTSRRHGPEEPVILRTDAQLDAEAAERRSTPPWEDSISKVAADE